MAREPIRWDTVAPPQFNNSALAIASGAFSSVANEANLLAEALRKREMEKKALQEQDALNLALQRAYQDQKFTVEDVQNLPPGAPMGKILEAFNAARTTDATLDESGANVVAAKAAALASNAAANWSQAQTTAYPDIVRGETALRTAQAGAATASQQADQERLAQIRDERSRATEAYTKSLDLEKRLGKFADVVYSDKEGSFSWQAAQEFPSVLRQDAEAKAKETGKSVEEVMAAITPEQMEEFRTQHRLDFIARKTQGEDAAAELYRLTGLTPEEQGTLTRLGQGQLLDEAAIRQSQADLATKREAEAELQKGYVERTQKGSFENVLYDGAGKVNWGPESNIGKPEAELLARTRYNLTDTDKVAQIRNLAPNKGAFENVLLEVTDPDPGFRDKTKNYRKFSNDFEARYGAIKQHFQTAAGVASQGPETIQTGTPVQNLRTNLQAAWSDIVGPGTPEAKTPELEKQVEGLKEQILAAKTDINTVVETLPESLKRDPAVATQLKSVMEALSGKKEVRSWKASPVGAGAPPSLAVTTEPMTQAEIDQRLGQWDEFQKILQQRINQLKASEAEKDALQKMFEELGTAK